MSLEQIERQGKTTVGKPKNVVEFLQKVEELCERARKANIPLVTKEYVKYILKVIFFSQSYVEMHSSIWSSISLYNNISGPYHEELKALIEKLLKDNNM